MTSQDQKQNAQERYTIEKITDIFDIPEDRFDDFLEDFKSFYSLGKGMIELVEAIADTADIKATSIPQNMVWIDDGKHDAKIIFTEPKDD